MLLEGAYDGRYEDVERWAAEGVRVDCVDGVGNRPLSEAANAGDAQMVELLLSLRADPNATGEFHRTALWRASYAGNDEARSALISSTDEVIIRYSTPLHFTH